MRGHNLLDLLRRERLLPLPGAALAEEALGVRGLFLEAFRLLLRLHRLE